MYQEVRIQNRTHAYSIWVYAYALFFKIIFIIFYPKALLDASHSCHSYATIWFQYSCSFLVYVSSGPLNNIKRYVWF